MKDDRMDLIEEYKTDTRRQNRLDIARQISYKKKMEIAIDLDLISEPYLDELIADCDKLSDEELLNETLPF